MRIRRPCRHDCDLASLPVQLALLACAACRTVGNTVEEYLSDFLLEMVEAPLILGLFFLSHPHPQVYSVCTIHSSRGS